MNSWWTDCDFLRRINYSKLFTKKLNSSWAQFLGEQYIVNIWPAPVFQIIQKWNFPTVTFPNQLKSLWDEMFMILFFSHTIYGTVPLNLTETNSSVLQVIQYWSCLSVTKYCNAVLCLYLVSHYLFLGGWFIASMDDVGLYIEFHIQNFLRIIAENVQYEWIILQTVYTDQAN